MNKTVTNTILINAPVARVWDVLTRPEETRKYMFGCETVSDWVVGGSLDWQMLWEGKELIPVSGTILALEPGKQLIYTVIDPNAAYPKTPENHLTVAYDLAGEGEKTRFTVSQYGFEGAADGAKRYQDVFNNGDGWAPMLEEIRKVAEA